MPPKRGRKRNAKSKFLDDDKIKEKEKKKQIKILFSDFDHQVEMRISKMNEVQKSAACAIRSIYTREISSYTKKIREMTVKEYFNQGGKINCLTLNILQEEISSLSNNISSVLSKAKKQKDEENMKSGHKGIKTTKAGRKVKGKTSSFKTKRITRSSRLYSSNSIATPLNTKSTFQPITPKFDPSLPTPNARKPRFGEIMVSLAGSPLLNCLQSVENKADVAVRIDSGKVIMSLPEKMDTLELDNTTKTSLMQVKDKLDKLLQG